MTLRKETARLSSRGSRRKLSKGYSDNSAIGLFESRQGIVAEILASGKFGSQ